MNEEQRKAYAVLLAFVKGDKSLAVEVAATLLTESKAVNKWLLAADSGWACSDGMQDAIVGWDLEDLMRKATT